MHYIVRDFDRKAFEARKRKMMEIAKKVGKGLHPDCYIELIIEDSYYNMRDKVMEHPHILEIAQQAMRDCDIEPDLKPIRGGTDGAQLSFMGLPCPNLFTGGYNYHGKQGYEFQLLQRFGMDPHKALVAATMTNAKVLGVDKTQGSVEKGKVADLCAWSCDPMEDVKTMQNCLFVMKEGVVVKH